MPITTVDDGRHCPRIDRLVAEGGRGGRASGRIRDDDWSSDTPSAETLDQSRYSAAKIRPDSAKFEYYNRAEMCGLMRVTIKSSINIFVIVIMLSEM